MSVFPSPDPGFVGEPCGGVVAFPTRLATPEMPPPFEEWDDPEVVFAWELEWVWGCGGRVRKTVPWVQEKA